jgi:hypothetical protein
VTTQRAIILIAGVTLNPCPSPAWGKGTGLGLHRACGCQPCLPRPVPVISHSVHCGLQQRWPWVCHCWAGLTVPPHPAPAAHVLSKQRSWQSPRLERQCGCHKESSLAQSQGTNLSSPPAGAVLRWPWLAHHLLPVRCLWQSSGDSDGP